MNKFVAKMETISLGDLGLFIEVARCGSLTQAANRLNLAKGVVSKALKRLETRLDAVLFERTTRRIAITPAGEILWKRGEHLLADVEDLRAILNEQVSEPMGTLGIYAPPELGVWLMATCFAPFIALYPHIHIRLNLEYDYQDLFDPQIDLTFRIGNIVDDSMVARQVGSFRRLLVASPLLSQSFSGQSLNDVADDLPMLGFRNEDHPLRLSSGNDTLTLNTTSKCLTVNHYPALLEAAAQGLGIAVLPDFFVRPHILSGLVTQIFPDWQATETQVYALYRRSGLKSRRLQALLEFIGPRFAELNSTTDTASV